MASSFFVVLCAEYQGKLLANTPVSQGIEIYVNAVTAEHTLK